MNSKKLFLILLSFFCIVCFSISLFLKPKCFSLKLQNEAFAVEIRDTEEGRNIGMQNRVPRKDFAMLFVFEKMDRYEFWMKDCAFDLDIVWLDDKGKIVDMAAMAKPVGNNFPIYKPALACLYALEMQKGTIERLHLSVDDVIFNK